MNPRIPRTLLTCRNCGGDIYDGNSPTGLVHAATERARCDGLPFPEGMRPARRARFLTTTPLAVAS